MCKLKRFSTFVFICLETVKKLLASSIKSINERPTLHHQSSGWPERTPRPVWQQMKSPTVAGQHSLRKCSWRLPEIWAKLLLWKISEFYSKSFYRLDISVASKFSWRKAINQRTFRTLTPKSLLPLACCARNSVTVPFPLGEPAFSASAYGINSSASANACWLKKRT
jgi:hypothetical protein